MILYFSATGNSKYVATRIASETNDQMRSIMDCCKNKDYAFSLNDGEALGIISPTYHFGLPSIVDSFLSKLQLHSVNRPYIYFVTTYGMTTGQSETYVKRHFNRMGYDLAASFCVRMPDTWTPIFDLTDSEKVRKINEDAELQIDAVIGQIKKKELGNHMKLQIPMFAVRLYRPMYEVQRKTKYLIVEDSCIGCGLCARICPVNAIEMRSERPVWIKKKCVMCLGCLHRCPTFSIQYGSKTQKHGQYLNPHVKI